MKTKLLFITMLTLFILTGMVYSGTLTNFSYSAGSYVKSATTNYTFNYTTATALPASASDAIAYIEFPNGFTVSSSSSTASITVNGASKTIKTYFQPGSNDIYIRITDDVPAGSSVTVVLSVTNYSTSGSYSFTFIETAAGGGSAIDVPASIDPIVLVDAALPVELSSFTATATNSTAMLAWKTATEVNNYGFEVERRLVSTDLSQSSPQRGGQGWGQIGFVAGNGTSNSAHSYSYTDASVSSGTYAYRLKQIDNDGTYKYSNEAEISVAVPTSYALGQNYPNPFNPTTVIHYQLPVTGSVTLKVYDIIGREIATLVNEKKDAGSYQVTFNASKLASGVYFYKLQAGSYSSVKKFLLMK